MKVALPPRSRASLTGRTTRTRKCRGNRRLAIVAQTIAAIEPAALLRDDRDIRVAVVIGVAADTKGREEAARAACSIRPAAASRRRRRCARCARGQGRSATRSARPSPSMSCSCVASHVPVAGSAPLRSDHVPSQLRRQTSRPPCALPKARSSRPSPSTSPSDGTRRTLPAPGRLPSASAKRRGRCRDRRAAIVRDREIRPAVAVHVAEESS